MREHGNLFFAFFLQDLPFLFFSRFSHFFSSCLPKKSRGAGRRGEKREKKGEDKGGQKEGEGGTGEKAQTGERGEFGDDAINRSNLLPVSVSSWFFHK